MPRNGAGVYSLPPSNPVVPNTTIATAWANPTLSDIAQALTDSLDRNGLGGMLSSFRISDGTIAAPGLAFTNELGLGLWRSGAGTMQFAGGGANFFTVGPLGAISPVKLEHRGYDTYMLTGQKNWRVQNTLGDLVFTPSATANAEDWDAAKKTVFKSDGNIDVSGTLNVGTLAVANLTVVNNVAAGGDVSANTVTAGNAVITGQASAKQFVPNTLSANISGAYNANFALGQSQVLTLTGPATVTPINVPVGSILRIALIATNLGVTWAASVKWAGGGSAPNLAAGTLRRALVVLEWDGTYFLGSAGAY